MAMTAMQMLTDPYVLQFIGCIWNGRTGEEVQSISAFMPDPNIILKLKTNFNFMFSFKVKIVCVY